MPDRYRTDLTLRTIYRDDKRIGVIDNPQDAAHIVKVLNTVQKLAQASDHHEVDDAVMALVLEVERRDTQEGR